MLPSLLSRTPASMTRALALVGLLSAMSTAAARPAADDPPITLCEDFTQARTAFLDPAEASRRRAHFLTMVQHCEHGFGHATEHLLDPVQSRRLRDQSYGELWENAGAVEFLREQVLRPQDDSWQIAVGAAEILADHADREILLLLLHGYVVARDHVKVFPGVARELGRAVASLRNMEEAELEIEDALRRLRFDLTSERALVRGIAAEALYRAGEVDLAVEQLSNLLSSDDPELDRLQLVEAFKSLLLQPDTDPGIKELAFGIAEEVCRETLAADLEAEASVMQRVSTRARRFELALGFLHQAERVEDFELLFDCYRSPAAPLLLTIDGLQDLRQGLQTLRAQVTEEQRGSLDEHFFALLEDAGRRLFELPEQPMSKDERRQWDATKDLRYNAASYLTELWAADEDFQATCAARPELPFLLENLVQADHSDTLEGDDSLYSKVAEKVETRLLAARQLGFLGDHAGSPVTSIDLPEFYVTMVCQEIGAPLDELLPAFRTVRDLPSPYIILELPKVRTPADGYVRDMSLVGLEERGFKVLESTDTLVVRKPKPAPAEVEQN